MIMKLLKYVGLAGKKAKETIDNSLDFIDDTLEAEYITGTIDKAKSLSGKVVQKAGETFEKGKMASENLLGEEKLQQIKEQAGGIRKAATAKAEQLLETGKAKASEALKNPEVKEAVDKIKEMGNTVVDGASRLSDQAEDFISEKLGLNEEE
jgi:ElaB/YqjD/DUF883 family membrane-anchored ribosome-binding protein